MKLEIKDFTFKTDGFPPIKTKAPASMYGTLFENGLIPDEDVRIDVADRDGVTGIYGISCAAYFSKISVVSVALCGNKNKLFYFGNRTPWR